MKHTNGAMRRNSDAKEKALARGCQKAQADKPQHTHLEQCLEVQEPPGLFGTVVGIYGDIDIDVCDIDG